MVLERKVKVEITFTKDEEVRYKLKINELGLELEEIFKGFPVIESFEDFEIVEIESMRKIMTKDDYSIEGVFEDVLIKGSSRPLLNYSVAFDNRNHKIVSKVWGESVGYRLIVAGGMQEYLKGKLIRKKTKD